MQHSFEFIKDYFELEPSFFTKKMFGGEALYFNGKMVLVLTDSEDKTWKGKKYKNKLWYGVLIPTEKEFHKRLIKKYSTLRSHEVLKKWLFLSAEDSNFEETIGLIVEDILKNNPDIGISPKIKL